MVIGNNEVFSYLTSGRPQISGFNTLLSLKVRENSSTFLPKGDLSSIFLCFCEVLSLFISTLVGNCVGYHKTGPILNPKSCTLQINPKLPCYFSGRTSFTRNGLFHTSETGYRFSRFTEYSTPEIFNKDCYLILSHFWKQERSIHYSHLSNCLHCLKIDFEIT